MCVADIDRYSRCKNNKANKSTCWLHKFYSELHQIPQAHLPNFLRSLTSLISEHLLVLLLLSMKFLFINLLIQKYFYCTCFLRSRQFFFSMESVSWLFSAHESMTWPAFVVFMDLCSDLVSHKMYVLLFNDCLISFSVDCD